MSLSSTCFLIVLAIFVSSAERLISSKLPNKRKHPGK